MENKQMIETGLMIPGQGYVQASGDAVNLADYPEGTKIVDLKPSSFHTFVGTDWVLDEALRDTAVGEQVRRERAHILFTVVDPLVTNPMRWAEMTSEKQAEWSAYRTALLNITDQAGFPNDITWPTKP